MTTKYSILIDPHPDVLAKRVQKYLTAGWECQGGVSATASSNGGVYAQAMIKKEQKNEYRWVDDIARHD